MRIHLSTIDLKCNICDKYFANINSLNEHKQIHFKTYEYSNNNNNTGDIQMLQNNIEINKIKLNYSSQQQQQQQQQFTIEEYRMSKVFLFLINVVFN